MNRWKRMAAGLAAAGILGIVGFSCIADREWRMTEAAVTEGTAGAEGVDWEAAERPKVALTFDDGPSRKYTGELLDGLKERGVKVSFFLLGRNIEGNEELVERIQEEGHLIGNHTYNHVQLSVVSEAVAKEEIERTSNEIYEITGDYPIYLRPPFGDWRKDLELAVEMLPVFWDVDTLDWETKNVSSIMEIVEKNVEDGAIILMHDGYETSVEAAFLIIDDLLGKGYEFVTVDEFLVA